MSINKEQVRTGLAHVMHPDEGADLVTLEMIQDIIVQDKYISFTLELPEKNDRLANRLKQDCEEAIKKFIDKDAVVDITVGINISRNRGKE
jgi:ATP-binding protein involved in chromosome partitioning